MKYEKEISPLEKELRAVMFQHNEFLEKCGVNLGHVVEWGVHWWSDERFWAFAVDKTRQDIISELRRLGAEKAASDEAFEEAIKNDPTRIKRKELKKGLELAKSYLTNKEWHGVLKKQGLNMGVSYTHATLIVLRQLYDAARAAYKARGELEND